jgi:hypothetical protein
MKHKPLFAVLRLALPLFLTLLACTLPFKKGCSTFVIPPGGTWNASFFDTGITLSAGQIVEIDATGSVKPSTANTISADPRGTSEVQAWQDNYSFRSDWPHEAVIARIGGGDYILIGLGQQFEAPQEGLLEIGVNDTDPGNNEGSFTIKICR